MSHGFFGHVDWAATGSMLQGTGSWAGAAAIVFAAWKGSQTFSSWRRQKQEERRIEVADRILTLAYKLRRNFAGVRSPLIRSYELDRARVDLEKAGLGFDDPPDARQRRFQTAQAILNRLQQHNDDWSRIFELMPLARAYFGESGESHLQKLWEQYVSVVVAAESYGDAHEDTGRDQDREFARGVRRDMFATAPAGEDRVAQGVDAAVAALEGLLTPILRSDGL